MLNIVECLMLNCWYGLLHAWHFVFCMVYLFRSLPPFGILFRDDCVFFLGSFTFVLFCFGCLFHRQQQQQQQHTKKYRFKFDNGVYCCWVFLLSLVDCWVSCCCCCCNLVCVCVPPYTGSGTPNIGKHFANVIQRSSFAMLYLFRYLLRLMSTGL